MQVWPCRDEATKDFLFHVAQNWGASRAGAPQLPNQRHFPRKILPFSRQPISIGKAAYDGQLELCRQKVRRVERKGGQPDQVDGEDVILAMRNLLDISLPVVYLLELEAELQDSFVKTAFEPSVPLGAIVPFLVNDTKSNIFVRRTRYKANNTGVLFTCWSK